MKEKKNLFCHNSDLKNESDVEQFFLIRLLQHLGYEDKNIKTKKSLSEISVGRGSRKEQYKPDYVCFSEKRPKIVLDAKNPSDDVDDYTYQVSGYALALNQMFKGENPIRYTALCNGRIFKLYQWDEEEPILTLLFEEFTISNKKFKKLVELIRFDSMQKQLGEHEITIEDFLSKPSVDEVKQSFEKCHNIIWKKEKISPTDAFYEFSKIIFVKLNEDKKIREKIKKGDKLKRADFKFSVNWLNERETETDNPLSSILFSELQKNIQDEIEKNNKKPIFLSGEGIDLKTPTIREVVKVLQNYDLYTIDEDLNGRMFETFLNATIRGRELGQYFTPRKVVKFMTKMADLKVGMNDGKPYATPVLDACCGSGGFLIDAMADMIEKVKEKKPLQPYKEKIIEHIKTEAIYGIDANPKISRIARMNMHVHGDGGSRVYCADSLDKEVKISKGTKKEIKKELEELREVFLEKHRHFDVVLSNPPFSMTYSSKDKDERRVLEQYGADDDVQNLSYTQDKSKLKATVKSNVLFLARYNDLLKGGGRLFIVLDNSVLNSYTHKEYRDYIRNNYLIKAVFQLPTHTFVNQEAGGITSILFLEKRTSAKQEQPPVFAREVHKVGHNKSGKEEAEDDFSDILKEWQRYEVEGKLYLKGEKPIKDFENDALFLIPPENLSDRIDVYFHQPSYHKLLSKLKASEKKGLCSIKALDDFKKIENIKDEDDKEGTNQYLYLEISGIDKERGFVLDGEWEEGTREELANRAKLLLKKNDLLFSKPFRSLPKVIIVPQELDGQLGSSGFYGIRTENYNEACLLWSVFRSNLIQKQFWHLCTGYTQRELNQEYLKQYLLIPIPKDTDMPKRIAKSIKKAKDYRKKELAEIREILKEPTKIL